MTIKRFIDGTRWTKALYWDGEDLKGTWELYVKVDGVRVIRDANANVRSRDDKPLHNVDHLYFHDAEFFYKDWNHSVSIVRSKHHPIKATQDMIYELSDGKVDKRLVLGKVENPTKEFLLEKMQEQLDKGHEGIIVRQFRGGRWHWIKVVPEIFADIRVLDVLEGKGKYAGVAGTIVTKYGNVGSFKEQFTSNGTPIGDWAFRKLLWDNKQRFIGMIIQVGLREVTEKGKMRFSSLAKVRKDKSTEDIPWLAEKE